MAGSEVYGSSTIGTCLVAALDEMVSKGSLSPEQALQIFLQFDKSMSAALETAVTPSVSVKGHLHSYRYCDDVWTFFLHDAVFKSMNVEERVGRVKIVARDSKLSSK